MCLHHYTKQKVCRETRATAKAGATVGRLSVNLCQQTTPLPWVKAWAHCKGFPSVLFSSHQRELEKNKKTTGQAQWPLRQAAVALCRRHLSLFPCSLRSSPCHRISAFASTAAAITTTTTRPLPSRREGSSRSCRHRRELNVDAPPEGGQCAVGGRLRSIRHGGVEEATVDLDTLRGEESMPMLGERRPCSSLCATATPRPTVAPHCRWEASVGGGQAEEGLAGLAVVALVPRAISAWRGGRWGCSVVDLRARREGGGRR
jgi:hypothetical protein